MADRGRRLVVAFGYELSSCGWAATADVVNYDVKRRLGEWESSFVGAGGRLQHVIVARSHDEAVTLRDQLNEAPAASVRDIVDARGLSRSKIEALRAVLDAAFAAHEIGDRRQQLHDVAWAIVDADERTVNEIRQKLIKLTAPKAEIPNWDDPHAFPFQAVVFDLDQTLVDSSLLGTPEARRSWAANGDRARVKPFEVGGVVKPHDLPGLLAERNVKVAIVTRAPEAYAARVRALFEIHADIVKAGKGDKQGKIRAAIRALGVAPDRVVVVGDDDSDVLAARDVGAISLGALWAPERWSDRLQPDVACREPEVLVQIADWRRLGFLGELRLEDDPCLHTGSWIAYGTPQRHALGRYFVASSPRHSDALTQTILTSKKRIEPDAAIARAIRLIGERVTEHASVDIVASVPPRNGGFDRFASYREIAATAFGGDAVQVLRTARDVPGYKHMSHARRVRESSDRFRADPAVQGKHVLVLDDVTTSGATFSATEEALEASGAAKVSCLSFAATQD